MVALRIGVLVPCRNEAAVIERKLANLAQVRWPAASETHRLLVIDDHSSDDTHELASGARSRFDGLPVEFEVQASAARPGKNGALEHGITALGETVDLVVLTDADVCIDADALVRLAKVFEDNALLGMACGEQVFVDSLREDHTARPAAAAWDRSTALVRRLESRFGLLFSVHGQLLAWRADLGLVPRAGVAADDVDLMLQVRGSRTPEVRLVNGARFFEQKSTPDAGGREQALRRARAWFQVFDGRSRPAGFEGLRALQWIAYSRLPARLPWIAALCIVMLLVTSGLFFGGAVALVVAFALALASATPLGREWIETSRTIIRARRLERGAAMEESWETTRT